jgi:hypothetical protein
MGAFMVWSLVLGCRLVAQAHRTRALPELAMGLAFLVSGLVGTGLGALARTDDVVPAAWIPICAAGGRLSIHAGALCQAIFTWCVFRHDAGWAKAMVAATALGLAGASVGAARAGTLGDPLDAGGWRLLEVALQSAAIGWGAVEALRYWRLMRRRVRLGLADPVVTNRFLLWAVAIGGGVCALLITGVLGALELPAAEVRMSYGVSATVGLISAAGYWLTFFPPRWYCALLVRGARVGV